MPSSSRVSGAGTAAGAMPAGPLLTTVPRGYVHRASVAEVLLTGWEPDRAAAGEAFVVRAQWPRGHALFAPVHRRQDPLLLVESIRQAGILLSHAEFGVPLGHQFLMRDLYFTASEPAFTTGTGPTDVHLHIVCHDVLRRGRTIAGMRYEVTVRRDGRVVAGGGAAFNCTSPAVHRRLRGERPTTTGRPLPPAVDPGLVGREGAQHVVLAHLPYAAAATPYAAAAPSSTGAAPSSTGAAAAGAGRQGRFEVRVDTEHPLFFDHPVDHIPGLLLVEAARQAARAVTGRPDALLLSARNHFARYGELTAPCRIEAVADPAGPDLRQRVRVRAVQQGADVFRADLVLGPGRGPVAGPSQPLAATRALAARA